MLTYLLTRGDLTPKEVNGHVIDLVMGGVDTVSNNKSRTFKTLAASGMFVLQPVIHVMKLQEKTTSRGVKKNSGFCNTGAVLWQLS